MTGLRDAGLSMIGRQFHTLIVQPATLCNLDCGYCYLPDRKRQLLMSAKVARCLAASIEEQNSISPVEVVWHGGEPLTTPIEHMRMLLAPFEMLRRAGRIVHVVQTNATLINEQWIELFREFEFCVGVSIDGPGQCNAARVDWAGGPSFAKIMHGIGRLRDAGIAFTVICVVTAQTIGKADELMDFFGDVGCESVAFNIEEMEGLNAHREQVIPEQAQAFWARLWELQPQYPDLRIRDLDAVRGYICHTRGERAYSDPLHDPIPTVGASGETVVLSPELLGVTAPEYGDFVIGNVLVTSLPTLLANMSNFRYVTEFARALSACAASCDFWDFCRGAQAANRFFEHGTFDVTETAYCRNTRQAVVLSAVDRISE